MPQDLPTVDLNAIVRWRKPELLRLAGDTHNDYVRQRVADILLRRELERHERKQKHARQNGGRGLAAAEPEHAHLDTNELLELAETDREAAVCELQRRSSKAARQALRQIINNAA